MWKPIHCLAPAALLTIGVGSGSVLADTGTSPWSITALEADRPIGSVTVALSSPTQGLALLQGSQGVCMRADEKALFIWTIQGKAKAKACQQADLQEAGSPVVLMRATNFADWGLDAGDPGAMSCQTIDRGSFAVVIAQPADAAEHCVKAHLTGSPPVGGSLDNPAGVEGDR